MARYLIRYVLPATGLFALALLAGVHSNAFFGLIGFVCFFTVGVTLLVEGWKRRSK